MEEAAPFVVFSVLFVTMGLCLYLIIDGVKLSHAIREHGRRTQHYLASQAGTAGGPTPTARNVVSATSVPSSGTWFGTVTFTGAYSPGGTGATTSPRSVVRKSDSQEPVFGYRAWNIHDHGILLSLNQQRKWEPGEEAQCDLGRYATMGHIVNSNLPPFPVSSNAPITGRTKQHDMKTCTCGYYAFEHIGSVHVCGVMGKVRLGGRMFHYGSVSGGSNSSGWRAQYAQPVWVCLIPNLLGWHEHLALDRGMMIAKRYTCDVYIVPMTAGQKAPFATQLTQIQEQGWTVIHPPEPDKWDQALQKLITGG